MHKLKTTPAPFPKKHTYIHIYPNMSKDSFLNFTNKSNFDHRPKIMPWKYANTKKVKK